MQSFTSASVSQIVRAVFWTVLGVEDVVAEAFSTTAADAFLSMTAGGSTDHSTMASSVHMDHVCLHGHTMEDGPQHRFLVASRTTDLIKASSCSIDSLSVVIKHHDLIQESI